jgi:PPK2 family polyphosphate:nucleotide phosphotransferase
MRLPHKLVHELMVEPGSPAGLAARSTRGTRASLSGGASRTSPKELAEEELETFKEELASAQELLYASDTWAVLLVFQALDAAGKDGTIKHVMSGVNPQGCEVFSFKRPSEEELRHDFLWRCVRALPERGRIGIFNRSYYEEVLVVRVHPEVLAGENLPSGARKGPALWQQRFEDINAMERHLARNGTKVVKFFLHVSKEEQRRRFEQRLDDPTKQWKFSPADLAERHFFDEYLQAYEEAVTATSTECAPWFVVPADHKPTMRALVAGIVVDAIGSLGLHYPQVSEEQAQLLERAREELRAGPPERA